MRASRIVGAGFALVVLAGAGPALAACSAPTSSSAFIPPYAVSALGTAAGIVNTADGSAAKQSRDRSGAEAELRRIDEQLDRYTAQRESRPSRLPSLNTRSIGGFLNSVQRSAAARADPPYIAEARARKKALAAQLKGSAPQGMSDEDAARLSQAGVVIADSLADGGGASSLAALERQNAQLLFLEQSVMPCFDPSDARLKTGAQSLVQAERSLRDRVGQLVVGQSGELTQQIARIATSGEAARFQSRYLSSAAAREASDAVNLAYSNKADALAGNEAAAERLRGERQAAAERQTRAAEQARADRIAAADAALVRRQAAAAASGRSAPAGSGGGGGTGGEPTDNQMKQAIAKQMSNAGGRMGMTVTITYFENLGCEKAQGRIGFNCDYLIRFTSNNPAQGIMDWVVGEGNAMRGAGRFHIRNGEWDFIPASVNGG